MPFLSTPMKQYSLFITKNLTLLHPSIILVNKLFSLSLLLFHCTPMDKCYPYFYIMCSVSFYSSDKSVRYHILAYQQCLTCFSAG